MARFTVRVELKNEEHRIPHEDPSYQDLHEKMEEGGFSQTIVGEKGEYKLPPAEYNFIGDYTEATQVRELASAIVKKVVKDVGYTYAILVTGPAERAWTGLDKAD